MKICVEVPATSANCCVGFDCLGIALDEIAVFHFEDSDHLIIEGCPKQFQNENNLVIRAFAYTCHAYHKEVPTLKLTIESNVPLSRGLGSSSTCVVAGIMAADLWMDLRMDKEDILHIADEFEGHPDNAAPAIFGQMSACFRKEDKIIHTGIDCSDFKALAIIPPYEVSTPMARKVLPKQLEFLDAVRQVGHALVFERAFATGKEELVFEACQDFLHEPYRKELIPEYDFVSSFCASLKVPFWISGSGPTMLVVSRSYAKLEKVRDFIAGKFPEFDLRILEINTLGALAYYE